MHIIYDIAYLLAAAVSSPIWLFKLLKTGKWRTDWRGKFGSINKSNIKIYDKNKRIIFHAVSVGEVAAIKGLVELLSKEQPKIDLIIATTTNTGHDRAVKLYGDKHKIVRYPLDFSFAVKRFLQVLNPDILILVELELWPNMLCACRRRNIPVCVINGRLSKRSFKRYGSIPWPFNSVIKKMFASLSAAGVQNEDYARRFAGLGTPNNLIHILDTMKWDNAKITDTVAGADELAAQLGIDTNKPIIVAGSTGPGEEQMLINACPKQAQLILVPRKPERFNEVASLDSRIIRRTQKQDKNINNPIFLIDTMGELGKAYALADIAVIGRSFNGQGGSDPIEPIALGKPTIIGKDYDNFQSVVAAFAQKGAIVITENIEKSLHDLLHDQQKANQIAGAGRQVIKASQGATKRHADMILKLIADKA